MFTILYNGEKVILTSLLVVFCAFKFLNLLSYQCKFKYFISIIVFQ